MLVADVDCPSRPSTFCCACADDDKPANAKRIVPAINAGDLAKFTNFGILTFSGSKKVRFRPKLVLRLVEFLGRPAFRGSQRSRALDGASFPARFQPCSPLPQ